MFYTTWMMAIEANRVTKIHQLVRLIVSYFMMCKLHPNKVLQKQTISQ